MTAFLSDPTEDTPAGLQLRGVFRMKEFHMKVCHRVMFPALCIPVMALGQTQPTPTFELTLESCPGGSIALPFGVPFTRSIPIYVTTSDNPGGEGAQGWSFGVRVDGIEPLSITTKETLAASVTDDPPGLWKGGFEKTMLGRCGESKGAVSAVVLSFNETITLPPFGPARVAWLTVGGTAPDEPGERLVAELAFEKGCIGAGKPVHNTITWRGQSVVPEIGVPCNLVVEGFAAPRFLRGDPNDDGHLDISDALFILGCKFLGEQCPGCRDAGDLNDDGDMDLSDAIYGLNFIFLGARPPGFPHETCGSDPTEDTLPDCSYAGCGV